ncbi:hypothetical protein JCM10296v2_003357 [Rhodotorula toruloides]
MANSSPPRTPISSTASSFLSFSPEAPATPHEAGGLSPSVYSFDDATPRASRTRILSNLNGDVPPVPRLQLPSSARRFGSRNPFAAMLAAEASESTSSRSSTSEDDGHPTSRSSTPATSSDDDLVVFEGCFVNPADPFTPAPRSSSLAAAWDACSVVDSLQAMGIDEDGDISSAWEDELYSILSESSPLSPSLPVAALQSPFLATGRLPSPRSPQPPKSPRKTRSPHHPASPRRHPFKRSTTETTIHASPRKSPQRSPRRSPHPPGSPSKTRRMPPANLLSPAFAPSSSSSSPDCPAFNIDPTSPVAAQPLRSKRSLAFLSLGSTGKSRREKPPPLPRASSVAHFPPSPRKSLKKKPTTPRRRRERNGDKSSPPRSARTADGIDLDELDRFFGITPKLAKAMRGGYEDVVMQERLAKTGRNGMDIVEDFRGLLDTMYSSDDGAGATRTSSSPRSSPRRRPPPLDLSHSSPHSRASSWTSSSLSADDESASPLFDDDDASALDACIHLASPVILAPFSAGRSAALAQAKLVATEDIFGEGLKPELEERKVLRTKKSVGNRLRDFLGERG